MKKKTKKSKHNPKSSTQQYLPFKEIRNGLVIMKDGSLRSVLYTSSVNFDLKSDDEQNAIIYQYQNFLNSLPFPMQIIVQSKKLDLTEYIAKLKDLEIKQTNDLLKIQMQEYIAFIQRLLEVTNVMEKKFYIIVSYYPTSAPTKGFFEKLFPSRNEIVVKEKDFQIAKEKITERINIITSGLGSMGLSAVPLTTQEISEMLYVHFNPITSRHQKLFKVNSLTSDVVSGMKE
ncbi:MAG TPA: hypothetical protein PLZ62_02365 [bacterium]|nr:hypothetical protein [bacterium]